MIHASTSSSARSSAATFAVPQQSACVHGSPGRAASITSIGSPKCSSKRFHVVSVSGKSTPVSIVNSRASGLISLSMCASTDSSFWKEQASFSRGWKRETA